MTLLARILYAMRGKRRVRLHLEDKPSVTMPSIEGVMVGRWCGHYVLLQARLITDTDTELMLEGQTTEVPEGRVVFVQVLR